MSDARHQNSEMQLERRRCEAKRWGEGRIQMPPPHPIYKRTHIIANVLKLSSVVFSITGNTSITLRENTACRRLTGGR